MKEKTELRIGNPDPERYHEIPDPNYGGVFIVEKTGSAFAQKCKGIEDQIKKKCIPPGIILAYCSGEEIDNASGTVITELIRRKIEHHVKDCNSCKFIMGIVKTIPSA